MTDLMTRGTQVPTEWLEEQCRKVCARARPSSPELVPRLLEVFERLALEIRRFDEVQAPAVVLLQAFARTLVDQEKPLVAARNVRWRDFCLAHACARGDARAVQSFENRFGPVFAGVARRFCPERTEFDELAQRLRIDFVVGAPDAPPRLRKYTGQAPLEAWLRVCLRRRALDFLRAETRRDLPWSELGSIARCADLDRDLLRGAYRAPLRLALHRAIFGLTPTERALLRDHAKGQTIEQLARMHGLHRSTAWRRVADAKRRVADLVAHELRHMQLDPEVLNDVLPELLSSTTFSLARLLGVDLKAHSSTER